ncbi:hypothetical protein ACFY40_11395 [Streptomyces sp. NPDC012950]|uniref:hypothetical protein n=1 Tax=Streptomyces sp. NPDC012950 TaxID=3364858 RepID=UPI0036AF2FBE
MTGPEHYREAERWLAHAKGAYLDTSSHPAPREEYASEEEWYAAISESAEAHELMLRETAVFAALGQAHATLALAAATALSAPVEDDLAGFTVEDRESWFKAAGKQPRQTGGIQ